MWPADQAGCGSYRLMFPATALRAQGVDVIAENTGPTVEWDRVWSGDAPPLDAQVRGVHKPDADIVVLQRPGRRIWCQVIVALQAHGVKVIVDVDDAFHAIPRANVAHPMYDPRLSPHHNHEWIAKACELADMVTVTTPALAKVYGRHGRVAVLPNLIPEWFLQIAGPREPDTPMVGWTGTVETHPHDLEVTAGAVHRALIAVPGSRFGVVGTGVGVSQRLRCNVEKITGWLPFEEYPLAMASVDVGIVPLRASPFNEAKSALKASEFAALGAVPVMSPTPDNQRLHRLGVGLLADSPAQWRKHLIRLLRSADLRAEFAGRGREVMAGQTYEQHCGQWHDAWTSTLNRSVAA